MNRSLKISSIAHVCLIGSERRVLGLDSEAMRGPGSIPIGGNILLLEFLFSHSEASDANIDIIANVV